jgi:hypothetical protein
MFWPVLHLIHCPTRKEKGGEIMGFESVARIYEALVNLNLVSVSSLISERAEALPVAFSHLRFGSRYGRI